MTLKNGNTVQGMRRTTQVRLWQPAGDGLQGTFLLVVAQRLPSNSTQQTARVSDYGAGPALN